MGNKDKDLRRRHGSLIDEFDAMTVALRRRDEEIETLLTRADADWDRCEYFQKLWQDAVVASREKDGEIAALKERLEELKMVYRDASDHADSFLRSCREQKKEIANLLNLLKRVEPYLRLAIARSAWDAEKDHAQELIDEVCAALARKEGPK